MAASVNSAGQKPGSVGIFVDVPKSTFSSPVQLPATDRTMPQESGSQNIANGDAATLPLPTPNFSIPPHLMGQDLENRADDLTPRGRKPLKPRLGVKVPYRNLSSQIVTQKELAQELIERSLKKYPVHDTPEGGDIFFAIKLTQRLANHIVPSASSSSGVTGTQCSDSLPKTDLSHKTENNSTVCEKNTSVHDQKVIADDKELLAILEGDVDPNWIPEIKATPQCQQQRTVPSAVPVNGNHFTTPPKLDPLLEKELALKQLMEFETTPRKKKTEKSQEKSPKKPKHNVKKLAIDALSENNAHNVTTEVKKVPKENDVAELKKKQNRKRKAVIISSDNVKKKKLFTKNISENIENGRADRNKVKKLQKDSKKVNASDKKISENVVKVIESVVKSSGEMEKIIERQSPVDGRIYGDPSDKPTELDAKSHQSETCVANVKNNLDKSKSCAEDAGNDAFSNNENIPTAPVSEVPELKNSADNVRGGTNKDSGEDQKLTDASSTAKKRARRSEVDKLLIDEGAINLLYEAELGDSRRRSAVCDNDVTSNNYMKKPIKPKLNSSRWKKKNLLLKTRLVKNAVLRLKSLQNPSVNLRAKRQLLCTTDPQHSAEGKMAPPKRMDPRDTLRSPPLLTVQFDPPSSSQSVPCPPRLQLRAEASRIIRRHSSSSTFSSRSTSPTVISRTSCDAGISQHKGEHANDGQSGKKVVNESQLKCVVKQGAEVRKKGVPIFIRKSDPSQAYKDKKVKEKEFNGTVSVQKEVTGATKSAKTSNTKIADGKILPRLKTSMSQKEIVSKEVPVLSSLKNVSADKNKFSLDVTKMHQKNYQKEKFTKSVKLAEENSLMKVKKKYRTQKSEVTGMPVVLSSTSEKSSVSAADVEVQLTTCLAEAASAFAAEDKTLQVSSPGQNTQAVGLTRGKNTSHTAQKKDINRSHPQSPNAASYVTLVKTLENDVQKQKRKDDEHAKSRTSIRQNAGTVSYRELSIRRYNGLVQIIMNPASTKMKNALNLQVLRELRGVLSQMKRDDSCRAVLLTSTGGLFCQGVDLHCVLFSNLERRKAVAQEFAFAIKDFIRTLAHFNKPLIAGVNGAAVGLGVTMLPFFDMVIASDKATFYTPYAKLGQVPEGGATMTFQYMFGNCLTSELLFGCRRITASEALHFGLVTRILWPDRFQEELIPIVRGVSAQSTQAMEATKALLRHGLRTKLEASLESEVHLLVQHWCTTECQNNIRNFLEAYEEISLQRQRIDPDL